MNQPSRSLFTAARRALAALGVAALLLTAGAAQAQITNETLIGDAVSDADSSRYADVKNAIERYGNRDFVAARTFLETAKRKNPKLPPVAVMLAKLHGLAGNSKAVRPALEDCITEAPDDPEPYLILAEDAIRGNRTIEADALFDKAVKLMQEYDANAKRKRDFVIRAYSGRTRIAQARRKWDQAASDLDELLKVDPENAAALFAQGQIMFVVDPPKAREGLAAFDKARKINEKLDHPYVAAGKTFESQGKTAEAMQYYEGAYKAAPNDESVIVAYGQGLLKDGKVDEAKKVLEAGAKQNADSANIWLLRGVAARMERDAEAARKNFLRTVSLAPTNSVAYSQLALSMLESGSDDETKRRALSFAATSQKLNTDSPDANITLAWSLYENGQARQATALLQNLKLGNTDPDSTLLLVKMLLLNNQKGPAKQLLTQALENTRHIFVRRDEAEKLLTTL